MLNRTALASRQALGRMPLRRFNHRMALEPNPAKGKAFVSDIEHTIEHGKSTTALWRNISIATVPILIVTAYYVYGTEAHHLHHLKEVSHVPDQDWPVEMEYQNVRWRRFFWGNGDKTAFWSWTNHHKGHDDE